jgi:hypothetical protein
MRHPFSSPRWLAALGTAALNLSTDAAVSLVAQITAAASGSGAAQRPGPDQPMGHF